MGTTTTTDATNTDATQAAAPGPQTDAVVRTAHSEVTHEQS